MDASPNELYLALLMLQPNCSHACIHNFCNFHVKILYGLKVRNNILKIKEILIFIHMLCLVIYLLCH